MISGFFLWFLCICLKGIRGIFLGCPMIVLDVLFSIERTCFFYIIA